MLLKKFVVDEKIMKNLVLAGMASLIVVMAGCTESETGLQKNVINTGFEECNKYLEASLKSPSSLRVKEVAINAKRPAIDDIYKVFGNLVLKDGKISDLAKDSKTRFREMNVIMRYEAQNSFGVFLGGSFQCHYLYRLENSEQSPSPLNVYLFKITNDGEDVGLGVEIPTPKYTGSNLVLNKQIGTLISSSGSQFDSEDEKVYVDLTNKNHDADNEKEVQKFKDAWGGWGS